MKSRNTAKVLKIQFKIPENVVMSYWKRAGFNIESTVGLVDLPETEMLVLSCNKSPISKLAASRI